MIKELSQERLKERLHYNPETGDFTWRVKPSYNVKIGSIAGATNGSGYIYIGVDKKLYRAHRLAFLYMTGNFPEDGLEVDHINHVKDDNRWANLRIVTALENQRNRTINKNNKAGHTGVGWHKSHKKWRVEIMDSDGKRKHLGYFDNKEEAISVRKAAELEHGFHQNHGKLKQTKGGGQND